ncbi:hypothetical protein ACWGJB_37315 [Streptomyces sp. NPDC054813]
MKLYIAVPLLLVAALIAASGIAAVTRGWVLPMNRRRVRAPRIYGWGQLVLAFALCWQLVFGLVIDTPGVSQSGTLIGSVIFLAGLAVMIAGQVTGRGRGDGAGRTTRRSG